MTQTQHQHPIDSDPGDSRSVSPESASPGTTPRSFRLKTVARTVFMSCARALEWAIFPLVRAILIITPTAHKNYPVRRSLWAGTPIINMAVNARAERLLGIAADSLVYGTYYLTDEFTYNLKKWTGFAPLRFFVQYIVLIWACIRYQRFHFYCDAGLLLSHRWRVPNLRELKLLNELGKQVFFWTYGADVRTRQITEQLGEINQCMDCQDGEGLCVCDDELAAFNYQHLKEHGIVVFSMGDMIEYTPGSNNNLFFWPIDLNKKDGTRYEPSYPKIDNDKPVHIVHAPNHPQFKGTRFLIEAVNALQQEGHAIELTLVTGIPNTEALEIYRTADIIFDQCINGFHGYFAIEGMAMGKPVVVYIRKPSLYLIDAEESPLISAQPSELESVLRKLVCDRRLLHDLGVRGRQYVEKYYSLEAFAGRLDATYKELGAV